MIGIQITELKNFMEKLLRSDCFDAFLLQEASVATAVSYTIDGRINKNFFAPKEAADFIPDGCEFSPWSRLRPLCFDLIKGNRTPLHFKFVLQMMPAQLDALLAEGMHAASLHHNSAGIVSADAMSINAAILTIRYDGAAIMLTTAISYTAFVPDKTPDKLWDAYILKFLDEKGIAYILP